MAQACGGNIIVFRKYFKAMANGNVDTLTSALANHVVRYR